MSQLISRRLRDRIAISPEIGHYVPLRRRADHALEFIPISGAAVMGVPRVRVLRGGGYLCLSQINGTHNVEAEYLAKTSDIVDVGVIRNLDSQARDDSQTANGAVGNDTITTTLLHLAPAYCDWLTRSVFVDRAETLPDNATFDIYEVRT